jgi:ATP-dependent RNA helicase RhlE
VYFIDKGNKSRLLAHYLQEQAAERAIVFTRTKHGADKLVKSLERAGIRAEAIHGNKSQNARQRALAQFKSHKPPVLVATDIAARGLDISSVSHVINFDLPMTAEIYVHRIGRTARAGAAGIAVTFCDRDERSMLRDIERLTRQRLNVAEHEFAPAPRAVEPAASQRSNHRPHGNSGRRGFGRPAKAFGGEARRGQRSGRRFSSI